MRLLQTCVETKSERVIAAVTHDPQQLNGLLLAGFPHGAESGDLDIYGTNPQERVQKAPFVPLGPTICVSVGVASADLKLRCHTRVPAYTNFFFSVGCKIILLSMSGLLCSLDSLKNSQIFLRHMRVSVSYWPCGMSGTVPTTRGSSRPTVGLPRVKPTVPTEEYYRAVIHENGTSSPSTVSISRGHLRQAARTHDS